MKPRSDSKLKNLPEERQEQIVEWCGKGLEYARAQLAADGFNTSLRALSEFWHWRQLQERFSSLSDRAQQIEELIKQKNPSMSPEKIREIGQALFTMEALDKGDAKEYVNLEYLKLAQETALTKAELEKQKLEVAREKLRQADRRIQLLEANAAQAKARLEKVVSKGGLTPRTLKEIEQAAKILG